MKIIIAGGGEVGFHLAKLLSFESLDIILIDGFSNGTWPKVRPMKVSSASKAVSTMKASKTTTK